MLNNAFVRSAISIGIIVGGAYGRWLALIKKALKDAKQQHKQSKSEKGAPLTLPSLRPVDIISN